MENVKYLYVRVKNANHGHRGDPIACVASYLIGNQLRYALSVARHVPNAPEGRWNDRLQTYVGSDHFDKNRARKIALGKLSEVRPTRKASRLPDGTEDPESPDVVIWSTIDVADRTAIGVTKAVFEHLSTAHHAPTHVRKAASVWLTDYKNGQSGDKQEYAEYLRLKAKFEKSKAK